MMALADKRLLGLHGHMTIDSPRRLIDLYLIRYIRQKPQLLIAIGAGLAAFAAAHWLSPLRPLPSALVGWDAFTVMYLTIGWSQMRLADETAIRDHAHLYDDGEFAVLLLSILGAIFSMIAIVFILAPIPGLSKTLEAFHTLLAVLTLSSSWAFIHTAFAFHYAHGYYFCDDYRKNPPLLFPKTPAPIYVDFLYFSFVIGTSGQTADVSFADTRTRGVGLLHCIVSYLFNAAVLGLTINIAASIISK